MRRLRLKTDNTRKKTCGLASSLFWLVSLWGRWRCNQSEHWQCEPLCWENDTGITKRLLVPLLILHQPRAKCVLVLRGLSLSLFRWLVSSDTLLSWTGLDVKKREQFLCNVLVFLSSGRSVVPFLLFCWPIVVEGHPHILLLAWAHYSVIMRSRIDWNTLWSKANSAYHLYKIRIVNYHNPGHCVFTTNKCQLCRGIALLWI